jgi:flagellar basal-body rod protein FlgF
MANGIYSALSGAIAQTERLDAVANNLANVTTPGYRQENVIFKEVLSKTQAGKDLSFTHTDGSYLSSNQGALQNTGRPLDAAMDGRGYFTVMTAGGPMYTRNGHFTMAPDGTLTNGNGAPVMGASGSPIRLSPAESARIAQDGKVYSGDNLVGELMVADLDERSLSAVGGGMYKALGDTAPRLTTPNVRGQTLEQSNVNALSAMTELISTNRLFDATQNAIDTYRQLDSKAANDLSRR